MLLGSTSLPIFVALGSAPTIAKGRIILDFDKIGVEEAKLVSNTLDRRTDIGSIAIFSASRDEADMVNAVVDRAVSDVIADIQSQKADNIESAPSLRPSRAGTGGRLDRLEIHRP